MSVAVPVVLAVVLTLVLACQAWACAAVLRSRRVLAAERPPRSTEPPLPSQRQQQTIVLAIDISRSMRATDVEPSRISAAQAAANSFIEEMPDNVRVGLVSFAGAAAIVQTPTTSREDLITAIDRFQLQRGPATGSGLILSLSVLLPDAGIHLESSVFSSAFSRLDGAASAPIERARKAERTQKKDFTPVAPGSYTAGTIILMSDGRRTTGPQSRPGAKMAAVSAPPRWVLAPARAAP